MMEVIVLFVLVTILFFMYLSLAPNNLYKYRKELGLEKANLLHAADYSRISSIVLSTRKTGFMKSEPIIWTKQHELGVIYMGTHKGKDLRLWMEVEDVLESLHIVLDSQGNHGIRSNMIKRKLPPVHVGLEGDFDKHFKLYCKPEQEVVALQIIAPDVMSYIIDKLSLADIEIVDNQIAIFVPRGAKSITSIKDSIELLSRISKLSRAFKKVKSQ